MPETEESSREDLVERARDRLGARGAGFVERWARPAVAIDVTDRPAGRSRFGGAPDLTVGAEWPRYDAPAQHVVQIDLAELPSGSAALLGIPAEGVLALFTPQDDDESVAFHDDGFVTALFGTGPVVSATPPSGLTCPAPRTLTFRACWDVPYDEHQVDDWPWPDHDDPARATYDALRDALHGPEYVGGWPAHHTLAYDPTPPGTVPLLTLTSREDVGWCWADGDTLLVFARPEDLAQGRFEALRSDAG